MKPKLRESFKVRYTAPLPYSVKPGGPIERGLFLLAEKLTNLHLNCIPRACPPLFFCGCDRSGLHAWARSQVGG